MADSNKKRVTIGQGADAFFGDIPETPTQEQKTEKINALIPEKQNTSNLENEQATKTDKKKYAKAGYRVSPESANQMEEMRLELRRRLGRKVYFEEMLEVMIDHAYRDLAEYHESSFLAKRLEQKSEK